MFGDFEIRLDPWQVEYGTELPFENPESLAPDEQADTDVEFPAGQWAAIRPAPGAAPARLVFVDGIRRVEARVVAHRSDRTFHGAFGSFAVGCVEVRNGSARVVREECFRRVALGGGATAPSPIEVSRGLTYEPISTPGPEPDAPLRAIHDAMRNAEGALAYSLASESDTLVIADGPLSFEPPGKGGALGFVKRLFRLYLPPPLLPVLASLPPGTRTPTFGLRAGQRFARLSWFLRLALPAPADTAFAGLVRIEVAASVGVKEASRLADLSAVLLPRFVPTRARDPRAPQNLLPIGGLESQLKRRLGDARLQRRWIETRLAREVRNA